MLRCVPPTTNPVWFRGHPARHQAIALGWSGKLQIGNHAVFLVALANKRDLLDAFPSQLDLG